MQRREFIQYGLTGSAALGAAGLFPALFDPRAQAQDGAASFTLSIEEVLVPVFRETPPVYMWAFRCAEPILPTHTAFDLIDRAADPPPPVPGPLLVVTEGALVRITLSNRHARAAHGFAIARRSLPRPRAESQFEPAILIEGPVVQPAATTSFTLTAPTAGTYLYFDPLNSPVNRVMGLHGALVVLPRGGNTPYANPSEAVQRLFDDLPTAREFCKPGRDGEPNRSDPGEAWDMLNPARNFVWLFNDIDEVHLNNPLREGRTVVPDQLRETFLPRFFTINGRTGFVSAHARENSPHGHIGEPVLIRTLNAGVMTHSPHIHGNHVFELVNELHFDLTLKVATIVRELDTWELTPLMIKDVLLPYRKPPDIFPWPPAPEQFGEEGMAFPMHCHMEISQTAAGGNYPQGAITDWVLRGPHQH